MNLAQLKSLCEIVDQGLRLSSAAQATYRTQSSVTRHLQELEAELGFAIFERSRNRIHAMTPDGKRLLEMARRVVLETENIRALGAEVSAADSGDLVIATTHTQARYVLPRVIDKFVRKYPKVGLSMLQATPVQCQELVSSGTATIAICASTGDADPNVVALPCYRLERSVVVPRRHPLTRVKPLTLAALAEFPIILYDRSFSARLIVEETFARNRLFPRIVLSAIDADVCKVYVRRGLGIAILTTVAFEPSVDRDLSRLDAKHLFHPSILNVVVRRRSFLRDYTLDFIESFAPDRGRRGIVEAFARDTQPIVNASTLPEV